MKKVLIFLIIAFFLVIGLSGFWYYQKNDYSKEILKLEILGPEYAQAGEEIEYLVTYKNNGDVVLENPELIFQFPDNSILENEEELRVTKKTEDLYPGEERSFRFTAHLLGRENETVEAQAWLSYQPKNLNARYESKTSFTTQIRFVPLTFEFDLPSKIETGQELYFSLNYFSNCQCQLSNLRVKIEYPEGFTFKDASPNALDKTEWDIGYLLQADGGQIEIAGDIRGDTGDQKIFRAKLGIYEEGNFIVLKEAAQSLKIVEPSLYISQTINNSPDYTANPGDMLHYEVFFKNIGDSPFQKKFMLVKLEGEGFDLETLRSNNGESGPGDNSIIFDWRRVPALSYLDAGEEGKVEFWIKAKEGSEAFAGQLKNPVLKNVVIISEVEKNFEVKLNSNLVFNQAAYFREEFFGNSGPLPPTVGEATTYTILWQVKNYWNGLTNVKVRSSLPDNVRPTGKIFPEDMKFTFDSESREVMWTIDELPAYQGISDMPLTLAFQVRLIPEEEQRSQPALLVEEVEISGQDKFTEDILTSTASALDTILRADDSVSQEEGIVQ
jgi:hypothetical protein